MEHAVALYQNKNVEAALTVFETLAKNGSLEARYNAAVLKSELGEQHKDTGLLQSALADFTSLPNTAVNQAQRLQAYTRLAQILYNQQRFKDALACLKKAIVTDPLNPILHNNLGYCYHRLQKFYRALAHFQCILAVDPKNEESWFGLVMVFRDTPMTVDMIDKMTIQALQQCPQSNRIANERAVFLLKTKRNVHEAHDILKKYIHDIGDRDRELRATMIVNLGFYHSFVGNVPQALRCYTLASQLSPKNIQAVQNKLLNLNYIDDPELVHQAHRDFAKTFTDDIPRMVLPGKSFDVDVGIVSPDFGYHTVSNFYPVLVRNKPKDVRIVLFSLTVVPDEIKAAFPGTEWVCIRDLSGYDAAKVIAQKRVRCLVDLAGHTGDSNIMIFAHQPAPLQVSYLGYPHSTGLSQIKYRVTDHVADPENFPDALLRMSRCFVCFTPFIQVQCPEERARQDDTIVFGSANKFSKITDEMIDVWLAILDTMPNARLRVKAKVDKETNALAKKLFAHDRVEHIDYSASHIEHLAFYTTVDVALDTFPYNGTTTSCEALYMGVPVITLQHASLHVGRVTSSILTYAGMPEYISTSKESYIKIAQSIKTLPSRQIIRQNLEKTVMDGPAYGQEFYEILKQSK